MVKRSTPGIRSPEPDKWTFYPCHYGGSDLLYDIVLFFRVTGFRRSVCVPSNPVLTPIPQKGKD